MTSAPLAVSTKGLRFLSIMHKGPPLFRRERVQKSIVRKITNGEKGTCRERRAMTLSIKKEIRKIIPEGSELMALP